MSSHSLLQCYKLLNISPEASDEEITKAFKQMALKYHPDRNRDQIELANEIMTKINTAYNAIMSTRFQTTTATATQTPPPRSTRQRSSYSDDLEREYLIKDFVAIREKAKDSLYRYFQYNLNNIYQREQISHRSIFRDIVNSLKKSYHAIKSLEERTDDLELLEHFSVFKTMLLYFYKASECINILDSYSNIIDVEAYRLYIKGDELLHVAHKEVFYERHNRGSFRHNLTLAKAKEALYFFLHTIKLYPDSSWKIEAQIKYEYIIALINYIRLFFSNDDE